jgi:outer membrane protein assembly factor BamB
MVRPFSLLAASAALCSLSLAFGAEPTSEWPTFRGAQRTATSSETGLLQSWPDGGPALVWKAAGAGRGYASLAISAGRLYTLGDGLSTSEDKDEYMTCFDLETGKQLWKTRTGSPWNDGSPNWQGSRSTPTVDGDRVYVVTPHSELICCESATGKEVWRKNLKQDFGGKKADSWGYSESVLIDGDRVVCTPGGGETTMVALNKLTGESVWQTVREDDRGAGHSSICISEVGGTRVYVQMTGTGALGVRAADGKVLWSYPIEKTTAVIPTVIVRGDLVFFAAGYKRGGALLRQKPGADGAVTVDEVYPVTPVLANKHGGVVLVGDLLFGDSDDQGIPFCADLMTGEIKWKKRGSGKGSASMIAADGRIYVRFSDGTLALANAAGDDYVELSSFKVPGSGERPSWSHPVIAGGKLYLREQDQILCYDIKAK